MREKLETVTGAGTFKLVDPSPGKLRQSAVVALDAVVDPSRVTIDFPRSSPVRDQL